MNQKELIDRIATGAELTKNEAGRALDAAIYAITSELETGGDVRLPGFGVFAVAKTAARDGRNPFTGEKIKVPAKQRAKFKEAKALKEMLNPVRLTGAKRHA